MLPSNNTAYIARMPQSFAIVALNSFYPSLL